MAPAMRARRFLAGGWIPLGLLALAPLQAAVASPLQVATDEAIEFRIPAQSLDAALTQYFRMSGVQLLYDSTLTRGRRTNGVTGRHTRRKALQLLLEGTGLTARYSRSRAAVLVPAASPARDAEASSPIALGRVLVREPLAVQPPPPDPCLSCYYQILERDLELQLARNPATAAARFDIVLAVAIDPTGRITSLDVKRGSGVPATDAALAETLSGLIVTRPPVDVKMPLVIVLRSKTVGSAGRQR